MTKHSFQQLIDNLRVRLSLGGLHGLTDEKAGDYAEDLAAQMLATTLGVKFDPDSSYDEKKQIWRLSDQIVKTTNTTQSAIGDKDGRWTTVVSAAVLLM